MRLEDISPVAALIKAFKGKGGGNQGAANPNGGTGASNANPANVIAHHMQGKQDAGAQYKKGGMTASRRADGIAQRGKTKGKMI
jgi:hypothetical protein